MNSPEALRALSDDLTSLPRLPRDEEGPVFAEPWQAQAFAMAVRLSAQIYFTWKEWADALAVELAEAVERGEADDGSEYYDHWLATLEKLITAKGLTDVETLFERKEAWADAYRHTPHGKPVQLRADFRIDYKYRQSPLHEVTRADGVSKQIRIQDGHLFVCNGCCCGRTDKGFPALPLGRLQAAMEAAGNSTPSSSHHFRLPRALSIGQRGAPGVSRAFTVVPLHQPT